MYPLNANLFMYLCLQELCHSDNEHFLSMKKHRSGTYCLFRNNDRQPNRPTKRQTLVVIGKFHFQQTIVGEAEAITGAGTVRITKIEPSFKPETTSSGHSPTTSGERSPSSGVIGVGTVEPVDDFIPEEEVEQLPEYIEVPDQPEDGQAVPQLLGSLINTAHDLNKFKVHDLFEL